VIGRNCNISQGVTLGQANRGPRKGYPVIGDNVYIGPGAKVIGNVRVGSKVAIGANCVVTRDVPDNAVAVGIPGHVVSSERSAGYVQLDRLLTPSRATLPRCAQVPAAPSC
jgi:serine O-acetyltransferase